jgi:hypothetical protein
MKRPWDETSANMQQNIPIFRDGLSVPENKKQNVPDPQKTSMATAPLLLPWQTGPGGAALPGMAKNDAALAPTVSFSAIRLHKKFGTSLVHFLNKI